MEEGEGYDGKREEFGRVQKGRRSRTVTVTCVHMHLYIQTSGQIHICLTCFCHRLKCHIPTTHLGPTQLHLQQLIPMVHTLHIMAPTLRQRAHILTKQPRLTKAMHGPILTVTCPSIHRVVPLLLRDMFPSQQPLQPISQQQLPHLPCRNERSQPPSLLTLRLTLVIS